jgi:hypothetical protein
MKVRRARNPSPGIEVLNLYSLLQSSDVGDKVLGDDQDRAAFLALVEQGLHESLANQRRLHGRWAQDLFKAVTISLDSIRMIKEEDADDFYFDHTRLPLHLPDFRLILNDDQQILVEVKNVAPSDTAKTQRLQAHIVEAEQVYARLTGAELYYAHFWAFSSRWTLVRSSVLGGSGKYKHLTVATAFKENEMSRLGDYYIGTESLEFTLSLVAAPNGSQEVVEEPDGDKSIYLTIVREEIYCDGQLIEDDVERRIARTFMLYSGLNLEERVRSSTMFSRPLVKVLLLILHLSPECFPLSTYFPPRRRMAR